MASRINWVNKKEILEQINKIKWYHSFKLTDDIMTPGTCPVDPKHIFDFRYHLDKDLSGKKILEIGTWDGPYAFELERRGADVTAVDIHHPDRTGFNTAKSILASNVRYVQSSIYDLPDKINEQFDIVFFLGIFYHLKHPLLAFENIQKLLKDNGTLYYEGECFTHYAEGKNKKVFNRILSSIIGMSSVPLALCYENDYKNKPNWFIPNLACLKVWLCQAGFEIKEMRSILHLKLNPLGKLTFHKRLVRFLKHLFLSDEQRVWGMAVKKNQVIKEHIIKEKNNDSKS